MRAASPNSIGGAGWEHSALTGTLLAEELAWGDLSMAMHILAPSLAILPIVEMGTEEQKKKYLPALCGSKFTAATAAFIEPLYDFDPNEFGTTAKETAAIRSMERNAMSRWRQTPAFTLVYAKDGNDNQGFIVEKGTKGLRSARKRKTWASKALATYELSLKDCKVPAGKPPGRR